MKNVFKLLAVFFVFVLVGAGAAYLFFEKSGYGRKGEVPELVGKSASDAAELLNKRRLYLHVQGRQFSGEVPEGIIISQLVPPGEKVRDGERIGVIVSRGKGAAEGKSLMLMPSFTDQMLDEAKVTVSNLNMRLKKVVWVHSDVAEKGRIIAQRPLPGSADTADISFLVSLGEYEVLYRSPSFVGMSADDAGALAKVLGIGLTMRGRGVRVESQRPEAGAAIKKGDTVEVTLGGRESWF